MSPPTTDRRRIALLIHSKDSTQKNDSFTIPRKQMILPASWTMAAATRKKALRFFSQFGAFILTRFSFWNCFSMLMLFAERADVKRYVENTVNSLQGHRTNTRDMQLFNKRTFRIKAFVFEMHSCIVIFKERSTAISAALFKFHSKAPIWSWPDAESS